ncbi:MAG TPA: M23 family metallopeptidase [Pyrinomonadaceae bacterium]|nr:M23 family metallopeptidase [Pyrinomonadaceae bacterium]
MRGSTRREFLTALIGAPFVLANSCIAMRRTESLAVAAPAAAPRVTNYNVSGRAALVEGKTLLIALTFASAMDEISGSFPVQFAPESIGGQSLTEEQPLFFYTAGDGRTFRTILSAPLDAIAGSYQLRVTARLQNGAQQQQLTSPYAVQTGVYRQTALTLDQNFSNPSPEISARMRRDFQTMLEIYQRRTERKWSKPFVSPVLGPDRANFGDSRTVNGTKHYRHAGLDYRAPLGTPVHAINDGGVALSDEQWTPGQTICIDHGGGVFSKYLHLSERRVQEGGTVRRGDLIALSGNTGGQRPAPHLHLDLVVNGTHVDPTDFMSTAARLIELEG